MPLKGWYLAALVLQASFTNAFFTGNPVAYLGVGELGAIPVIESYDFEVNDAGTWSDYLL